MEEDRDWLERLEERQRLLEERLEELAETRRLLEEKLKELEETRRLLEEELFLVNQRIKEVTRWPRR